MDKCIFCNNSLEAYSDSKMIYYVKCPCCGEYEITEEAFEDLPHELENKYKKKKHLISGYLREVNELGIKADLIKTNNLELFINNSYVPTNMIGKIDKLLMFINRRTEYFGQEISRDDLRCASICYAFNAKELESYIDVLFQYGDLQKGPFTGLMLTVKGFNRIYELERKKVNSHQAFVAMWFSDSMNAIYEKYIYQAIIDSKEKNFFKALRIDKIEHINKIDDQIIAEIRKSRFLIADFTGQRGGVYYEAGFAHGLGIPVIWTCRKDEIDNLHFDIRQYNCIVWESGEELYDKLKNRIEAVIV